MKNLEKRVSAFLISVLMLLCALPMAAEATSKTADDGIAWARSKVGQAIDWDNQYGAQCVDLIMAYYNYLGVSTVSGNGADYAWNGLPSGWTRVEGGTPQKGDILVYYGTADNEYNGHVAIYESDHVHYDQNIRGHYGVVRCEWHYNYNGNYWGYIRPNWSGSSAPSITLDNPWADPVNKTAAIVHSVIRNNRYPVPQFGCWVWKKSTGKLLTTYRENIPANLQTMNYIDVWVDTGAEMGIELEKGTEYEYQFFVELGGNVFQSSRVGFKTPDPTPQKPNDVKLSANANVCRLGEETHLTFSAEGAEYFQLLQNGVVIREKLVSEACTFVLYEPGTYTFQLRAVNTAGYTESDKITVTVKNDEAPVSEFTDVKPSDWYYNTVMDCVSKGLFTGISETCFAPEGKMTRAMFFTVLARMSGINTNGGATWYEKGMNWARTQGISDGTSPMANVTREQVTTMLYRYDGAYDAGSGLGAFSDASAVSPWAKQAMSWAVNQKIVTGKEGKLVPKGNATRAEVATMLYRYREK